MPTPRHPGPEDRTVKVVRYTTPAPDDKAPQDKLSCQHLELRLSHKDGGPGPHDDGPDRGLTIDSAHAVGEGEGMVELHSDEQKLSAWCYDLQYDARTRLTVLKQDPNKPDSGMKADQEGNKIHARELQILELPPGPDGKAARQVTALGPGQIDLLDKTTKKLSTHAAWREKLVSTKDGAQDLIVLSGAATFTDDEHDQALQADTLKVWLTAAEGGPAAATPANPQAARRPSHVEAVGNVSVRSSELTIPHAGLLVVWFHDVPGEGLPAAAPTVKPGTRPRPALRSTRPQGRPDRPRSPPRPPRRPRPTPRRRRPNPSTSRPVPCTPGWPAANRKAPWKSSRPRATSACIRIPPRRAKRAWT